MPFSWPFARSPSIPGLHSSQLRSSPPPSSLSRSSNLYRRVRAELCKLVSCSRSERVLSAPPFSEARSCWWRAEGDSSVALDAAGILAAVAVMAVVAALAVRRATQDASTAGQTSRAAVTTLEDGTD